jgi:hypothetical protein
MQSMTYGNLPTKRQFMAAYEKEFGDDDFAMTLRGRADMNAVDGTVFESAIDRSAAFDADDLWKGVKQLTRRWNDDGDEGAGDLASSILGILEFEWI